MKYPSFVLRVRPRNSGMGATAKLADLLRHHHGQTNHRTRQDIRGSGEGPDADIPGGSEDLFQSATKSRLGDLYLPGEPSFHEKHLADGLFGEYKIVNITRWPLLFRKATPSM